MDRPAYREQRKLLQIELLKLQRHVAERGLKLLAIFEGRDAAGKGGAIKRIAKHLPPRGLRVVALRKPDETERGQWYFQRYVAHLPTAGEIVLFDRSWYNRAGLERVMGYCTPAEAEELLVAAPQLEHMLIRAGLTLVKLYFAVSRAEQARRIERRRQDPLKQWKLTPLDGEAQARWDDYGAAERELFRRTSTAQAPWQWLDADDKRRARLEAMRCLLRRFDYPERRDQLLREDTAVLRTLTPGSEGP